MLRGEAVKPLRSFAENSVAERLSGTDMPDDLGEAFAPQADIADLAGRGAQGTVPRKA